MKGQPESIQSNGEAAQQVASLLRSRKQLKAAGGDISALNQQIGPYRAQYVRAGTKYGKNYAGMLKWFRERTQ